MKYSIIKKLGHTCRGCLNNKFDLDLVPKDCRYMMYPSVCTVCGKVNHIVTDIKLSKRISIRFG